MQQKTKIFFRASADSIVGWGHLFRIIALSQLIDNDYSKILVAGALPFSASSPELSGFEKVYTGDDAFCLSLAGSGDVVVVDDYKVSNDFFLKLRAHGVHSVYIDDLMRSDLDVDAIINHAPGVSRAHYVLPAERPTQLYLGLEYALLRKEFYEHLNTESSHSNQSLFICFGGSNNTAVREGIRKMLPSFDGFDEVFWIDPTVDKRNETRNLRIMPQLNVNELIAVMKRCSYALVSASTIAVECFFMHMKLLLVQTAANQKYIYEGLGQYPQVCGMGTTDDFIQIPERVHTGIRDLKSAIVSTPGLSTKKINEIFKKITP